MKPRTKRGPGQGYRDAKVRHVLEALISRGPSSFVEISQWCSEQSVDNYRFISGFGAPDLDAVRRAVDRKFIVVHEYVRGRDEPWFSEAMHVRYRITTKGLNSVYPSRKKSAD